MVDNQQYHYFTSTHHFSFYTSIIIIALYKPQNIIIMNKALLINILNLAIEIEWDKSLLHKSTVTLSDFSNEDYSVRDIRYITQCFNFKIQ